MILPEYHLASWSPSHPDFLSACRESVNYLPKYQKLAQELNINIIPGTICEPVDHVTKGESNDTTIQLRNIAYFIAAGTGAILSSYQKRNLWHPERPYLAASDSSAHLAFDTPLVRNDGQPLRAGLLICWDLAFPEAFRALVADGANVIFIPAWWHTTDLDEIGLNLNPDSERAFLENVTTARAFEGAVAVVFCNAGGLSGVSMPILGTPKRIPVGVSGMEVMDIDVDALRVAEENYKIRMDILNPSYHYGKP